MLKVLEEPEMTISMATLERLHPLYEKEMMYTVSPVSFETWYRSRVSRHGNQDH